MITDELIPLRRTRRSPCSCLYFQELVQCLRCIDIQKQQRKQNQWPCCMAFTFNDINLIIDCFFSSANIEPAILSQFIEGFLSQSCSRLQMVVVVVVNVCESRFGRSMVYISGQLNSKCQNVEVWGEARWDPWILMEWVAGYERQGVRSGNSMGVFYAALKVCIFIFRIRRGF